MVEMRTIKGLVSHVPECRPERVLDIGSALSAWRPAPLIFVGSTDQAMDVMKDLWHDKVVIVFLVSSSGEIHECLFSIRDTDCAN
jgi:hypothetical protein